MPLYDYQCPDCGLEAEEFQKMSEPKLGSCPNCGSTRYARLISTPNFAFKNAAPNNQELTRKAHGLQRGEQIFENPRTGEVVHLSGSKKERQGQIARSLEKAGYDVATTKDVETPNL